MRYVYKNLEDIPSSLNERKTKTRRNTLIRDKKYHNTKLFNQRFKQNDIKNKLSNIYINKCAYCEEYITKVNAINLRDKEEQSHTIEHYRPKSQYWWLAYSWDNLLWCCVECNKNKANNFEIVNPKIEYSENFMSNIHTTTTEYNRLEQPKMIHPELEDINNKLIFNKKGLIYSEDIRVKYTINSCKLDRNYLNDKRKSFLDKFLNDFKSKLKEDKTLASKVIVNFLRDSQTTDIEFTTLHHWIRIKDNLKILLSN